MRRAARIACLFTAFAVATSLGCSFSKKPRPDPTREVHAPFTLRPLGISSTDFVRAADDLISERAPRYRRHSAEVHLGFGLLNKYGITNKNANGDLYIVLGRPALMMATVEDLAVVLLHEYVHVVYWEHVFGNSYGGATEECKKARAEMLANKVTIELYHTIRYRRAMLLHAMGLYRQAHAYARVMECPIEISIDMPKWVVPKNLRGPQPVAPLMESPEYLDSRGNPDDYLNPWDDPNKTDPLYPYHKPTPEPVAPSNAE